ncbi:hypothetical protein RB195_014011 [Necator americanus]|uniref:BUD13 homolog n=1 Tax=Necator americanus TaxID=51031 RepID=A0ABR1DY92_NECAM
MKLLRNDTWGKCKESAGVVDIAAAAGVEFELEWGFLRSNAPCFSVMATLSKAEYLQRYLSSGKEAEEKKAKKKKKKTKVRAAGLRIVEDDAFLAVSAKFKDIDSDEEREDIAIISSISKQIEEKAREAPKFRSSFKPLDAADEDVKPELSAIKSNDSQPQNLRKRHDSDESPAEERDHSNSGQSPVRKRRVSSNSPSRSLDHSKKRRRHDSGSDLSTGGEQFRRGRRSDEQSQLSKKRHNSKEKRFESDHRHPARGGSIPDQASIKVEVDSDHSPSREDQSPPRKDRSSVPSTSKSSLLGKDDNEHRRQRHDTSSDQSPPRKRLNSPSTSKSSGRGKCDKERPRRRHDSSSDQSPPRKRPNSPSTSKSSGRGKYDNERPRRRHDSSSDQSPPRKRPNSPSTSKSSGRGKYDNERPRRRHDSSSDQSPPRKRPNSPSTSKSSGRGKYDNERPRRRHDSSSDQSPPRKRPNSPSTSKSSGRGKYDNERPRRRHDSSSDQSPPRKRLTYPSTSKSSVRGRYDSDESPPRMRADERRRPIASPEKLNKETQRTLDGKVAGLQSAEDLKKESEKIRQRETKMFEEMDASVSGRYAETTVRQKHVRKRHEKPEDKERKEREAKKQAELEEKYKLWNKGVEQSERRGKQLEEMARVAAEPLARMADDEEMNRHLKDIIYEEDPMAEMLMSRKREEAMDEGELVYPTYQGEFPPNRFGIRPGYRWDGVDRSNGFEAKLAQAKNRRNAQEKEYYQNLQLYE